MNNVQSSYSPPRLAALIAAAFIFVTYQSVWRGTLPVAPVSGHATSLPLAILFSIILGYGVAMLGWLGLRTRGQLRETFRPTRGRILGAICLALITPFGVYSWMPFILGALLPAVFVGGSLQFAATLLVATMIAYPVAAMIIRHTYARRGLRFFMFALVFWSTYSAHILLNGEQTFSL